MKPNFVRRFRRRATAAKSDGAFFKKDSQETFFGGGEHDTFFQPAVSHTPAQPVQRKCEDCEKEDKVQREPEKKEEEKVMRSADLKEKSPDSHRELQRAPEEKKEDEKVQREPEKKEEEKVGDRQMSPLDASSDRFLHG